MDYKFTKDQEKSVKSYKITDDDLNRMYNENSDIYLHNPYPISVFCAEIIRLRKLEEICKNFLEYRNHNTLNFQLEKADDFFREIRNIIEG
jgi:hypothetical protein